MARAQGINTEFYINIGLAISNGLIGLSGGLIAQYMGFSDVQMGVGAIVIGLASLIIGEVVFGRKTFKRALISISIGAVAYRVFIAFVFELGMPASDLKLFTALTVIAALCLPNNRNALKNKPKGGASGA
jgi:putative ABC transport system permease protein